MFSKIYAVASALAALTLATFTMAAPCSTQSACDTGSQSCCNSLQDANDPSLSTLLGSLGLDLSGIVGQVGLTCSPITGIGAGAGASCSQQPVCCTNDTFNGLIAIGCTPINIVL